MSEETMNTAEFSEAVDASFKTFKDEDQEAWDHLRALKDSQENVTVTVSGIQSKGVVAMLEGVRGFIPASRLSLAHVDDLNTYLDQELDVRVIEIDEEKNRLILSAREILREAAADAKRARIESVAVGTVMDGSVESLKPYGAFIRLEEGLSGLVHVSQISKNRIKDPSQVLNIGDQVKVKVIAVKDGKLSLSIKALAEDQAAAEEEAVKNVKIPEAEKLTTNIGDLLKNIKL